MRIVTMLLAMILSLQAFGGRISGKVSDEKTGEAVIGATVVVKGTPLGTATDVDGNYSLTIADGTYTLEVKYLGYQTKEVEGVAVVDATPAKLNIIISEASSTQLQEVVVRSSLNKENISALYILQKNNLSVSSGISADVIQRSPDRNTGEVLKRVSGASIQDGKFVIIRGLSERYNAAMINGAQMQSTEPDKKAFSYDVIPSNLIDNIIINKTASADMPGDFAGGVVQVLTKDVPDNNFFNVGLSLGYNTQTSFKEFISTKRSGLNMLGFSDPNNALPGSFGNSSIDYKSQTGAAQAGAARQLGNKYEEIAIKAPLNTSLQMSLGDARAVGRGKLGSVLGVVYRNGYTTTPDFRRSTYDADGNFNSGSTETSYRYNSSLAGLANFSYVAGRSKISLRNIFNAINEQVYYQREGSSVSSSLQFRLNSTVPSNRRIYSTQLEGDHALGSRNAKFYWNMNYASLNAKQQDLRTAYYMRTGTLSEGQVVVDEESPYELVDRNSRRFFTDLKDNNYGGNFHFLLPFNLFNQKQSLKVGYLGMQKTRSFQARNFQYDLVNYINNPIKTMPVGEVFAPENISENNLMLEEITSPDDAYDASSLLNGGFIMFDNHFNEKLRLSWGARFESYTQTLNSYTRSNQFIDRTDVFNDFLPSINLSYSPKEEVKIRLSGSQTVNRPEFRELAPFQFVDFENNWTVIGNPELFRANVSNADLRYEYYPGPGEAITVGAFYKHFANPIEFVMNDQSNYDLFIFGYRNSPSATAYGAEVEFRKNLSFVADAAWLNNLTLAGNFTYTYSKVDVSKLGYSSDRPMQGQSPYLINFSMLYNDAKTGLGFSALYNRIGDRIFIVGKDDIPNVWERARNVVDFQVSKSLLKNRAELKLTVADILNQPFNYYWDFDGKTGFSETSDRVFQHRRMGTNVTVGFNYRFGK